MEMARSAKNLAEGLTSDFLEEMIDCNNKEKSYEELAQQISLLEV